MKDYLKRFAFYMVFCVLLTLVCVIVAEGVVPGIAKVLAAVEPITINPWVKLTLIMVAVCGLISIKAP